MLTRLESLEECGPLNFNPNKAFGQRLNSRQEPGSSTRRGNGHLKRSSIHSERNISEKPKGESPKQRTKVSNFSHFKDQQGKSKREQGIEKQLKDLEDNFSQENNSE